MKKTIKKLICLLVAVVAIFAATSTFSACDVLESLFANSSSSSDSENDLPKVEIESGEEINKLVPAREVVAKKQHSQTVKDSWYDDEGNYNYIIYLGRINNFLLHNVYSFQYTKNYKVFGDTQITLKQATEETVKTAYTKTVQKTTSRTIEDSFKVGVDFSDPVFSALLGDSVKVSMESQMKDVFSTSCTETDSSAYSKMTTKTQETIREFTLDYDQCVINETYSYCIVTDVDVYAAICYTPESNKISYEYYSDEVGAVRDIVFSSTDEYFDGNYETFEIDFSEISFEKPEKFITNHPEKKLNHTGAETWHIPKLSKAWTWCYFGDYTKGNGEKIPIMKYYEQLGYNKVKIEISFRYYKESKGKMYFSLCATNDFNNKIASQDAGASDQMNYTYDNIDLSTLSTYNKIYFVFECKNIYGYYINGLKANFTVYKA